MPQRPKLWSAMQGPCMLVPCEYLQETHWAAKHYKNPLPFRIAQSLLCSQTKGKGKKRTR